MCVQDSIDVDADVLCACPHLDRRPASVESGASDDADIGAGRSAPREVQALLERRKLSGLHRLDEVWREFCTWFLLLLANTHTWRSSLRSFLVSLRVPLAEGRRVCRDKAQRPDRPRP
jgi:hypothetical protein